MKKILSVIVAIALCAVFTVCAFAEEANVSNDALAGIVDGVGALVDAESEGDDAALESAINDLYKDIQGAQVTGDANALVGLLAKYAEGADVDATAVFSDLGALQDVLEKFLSDSGFNMETVKGDLQQSSALNTLVGLYTGAYTETPATPEAPEEEDVEPEIENPSTGDSATGVVVALATLAVSAAAAVVLTKKD